MEIRIITLSKLKLFTLFLVLTLFSVQATFANKLNKKKVSTDTKTEVLNEVLSQAQVTGVVKDETGIPLVGVNVLVQGTSRGALTDFDGNYKISATKGDLIVFSF
ncbi:MAG: carboxypeptidase-like regulatory domain-containing protein, partial [Algibacter sp.]